MDKQTKKVKGNDVQEISVVNNQENVEIVSWKKELFSWMKILFFAIMIGMLLSALIKPTLVSGVSMYPTLDDNDYLILNRIAYKIGEPQHGDIVVFKSHLPGERNLIKRIVAVEGDKITIKDGKVFVNDQLVNEPYVHGVVTDGNVDGVVPKDKVFAMGDNRPNSLDSRSTEVGFVDKEEILGKVWFRLIPFKTIDN